MLNAHLMNYISLIVLNYSLDTFLIVHVIGAHNSHLIKTEKRMAVQVSIALHAFNTGK